MIRDFARRIPLSVIMALVVAGAARPAQAFVDDVHGKEWRQLTETVGLSWDQVAQVCPQDGASACVGSVGGIDLTDWVWASDSQTIELFSYFEPDILTSPVVSGQKYFFTATTFMNAFQPTFSVALTYQAAAQAAGWTSSTDPTGVPVAGAVSWGTTSVSIGGQFGVEPMSSPGVALGVFLWRATGLGTGAAYAYDDVGQLASPAGGTAVANVLANDWIGGAPATTDNVTLFQLSSTNPRVTLDILDGSVDAAAGVRTLWDRQPHQLGPAHGHRHRQGERRHGGERLGEGVLHDRREGHRERPRQRFVGRGTGDDIERDAGARVADSRHDRHQARCHQWVGQRGSEDELRPLLSRLPDLRDRESHQLRSGDGDDRLERRGKG